MTVDISALRAVRSMARPGARHTFMIDYDGEGCRDCDATIVDERFYIDARNALIPTSQGGDGMIEAHESMRAALEAVLLFYSPPPWDLEKLNRWKELTGFDACTSKVLCDTVRKALGQ